jgi:hypothetical protein
VIESVPVGNADVVSVAVLLNPPPGISVALPIAVAPSIKVTDPVGAALLLETVAVKVTDWPALTGFAEDVTDAAEAGGLTIWLNTAEVAAPLLPFPA